MTKAEDWGQEEECNYSSTQLTSACSKNTPTSSAGSKSPLWVSEKPYLNISCSQDHCSLLRQCKTFNCSSAYTGYSGLPPKQTHFWHSLLSTKASLCLHLSMAKEAIQNAYNQSSCISRLCYTTIRSPLKTKNIVPPVTVLHIDVSRALCQTSSGNDSVTTRSSSKQKAILVLFFSSLNAT